MNGSDLKQRLLAAEAASPELERRYRERLRALTERRLSGVARAGHALGLVLALASLARLIQLFQTQGVASRPVAIVGLATGIAFSGGWAVAEAMVLRAGVERLFSHGAARMMLLAAFTFVLAGLMLWAGLAAPDPRQGALLILFGLVFWCAIGLPVLLIDAVRRTEARVRADVLRLELALAERAAGTEVRA